MQGKKQNKLIRLFCGGANISFRGESCYAYDRISSECMLLREKRTEEFWKKCRCEPFVMLYEAGNYYIRMFEQKYPWLPINEDIDFSSVIGRLKDSALERDFHIQGWRRYMFKAVYREIKNGLKELIPRDARCGTCKYLPEMKPYTCRNTGKNHKKSDKPCKEYIPKTPSFGSISSEDIGDRHISMAVIEGTEPDVVSDTEKKDLVYKIKDALSRRIDDADPGSKQRAVRKRQYEIFINLGHLISEGLSETAAVKSVVKRCGVSKKTITRDIKEIRDFLKKNVR